MRKASAGRDSRRLYYLSSACFFVAFTIGAFTGNLASSIAFLPLAVVFAVLSQAQARSHRTDR